MSAPALGPEEVVDLGDVRLCVQTAGDPDDPVALLIAGAASPMTAWDDRFVLGLAAARRFVVRYDHRDTGRSSTGAPGSPDYTARDLQRDPLRILDHLGVERAHLVGVSMGGGIVQEIAARHPERVLSATLVSTSPAGRRRDDTPLPGPTPAVAATFSDPAPAPDPGDPEAVVAALVEGERPFAGAVGFDEDAARDEARHVVRRTEDPAAASNHFLVVGGEEDGDAFRLADVTVPTLVVHGTTDPLFPLEHGRALAAEIPGARLLELTGGGHEHPRDPHLEKILRAVVDHTAP
ncbi:alpha/beta fold hydrolase [Phycicoccus sp. BSK3Z-2]|uniref:Alpha/beta fold hydrolase n=1 Tax=Phycicoccus avicenniae TaxID=2828860 RepID=A0A941D786_9MICO|nr:alpha/beta fold hydrolase [Phycicoccus avicenniae]MBR7742751.1 alpha/beta fold hydrolase [Phycicoccus avicenniae]